MPGIPHIFCQRHGVFYWVFNHQGEKSINFYFIRVPLRKKVLKYGTPKPSLSRLRLVILLRLVKSGLRIGELQICVGEFLQGLGFKGLGV